MSEYRRFVSYIYSYPGGVKDKNVGFAKVCLSNGQLKIDINLKGVYTDVPQLFGVHILVDKDESVEGRYTLLKLGDVLVKGGIGQYQDLLNANDINGNGYEFSDISGIAIANEDDNFYMMFSMWEDADVNTAAVHFVGKVHHKNSDRGNNATDNTDKQETEVRAAEVSGYVNKEAGQLIKETDEKINEKNNGKINGQINERINKEINENTNGKINKEINENTNENVNKKINIEASEKIDEETNGDVKEAVNSKINNGSRSEFDAIFENADFIDAFDDDYFYDCVEVTPETIMKLPIEEENVSGNSFLMHGYYNFRHILFGKVVNNSDNTRYFIGVPGMYCNRERFMASMFGFNNFKKSHRSDYTNPYFGYWYKEI